MIWALGKEVVKEEKEVTCAYKEGHVHGEKQVPVLFEEVDGVYIKLQRKDRKESHQKKVKDKSTVFQLDPFHKY